MRSTLRRSQMKCTSAARLRLAAALLLGIAVGFSAWIGIAAQHVQSDSISSVKTYERGYSDGVQDAQPIYDKSDSKKSGYMPLFLQKDPQWSSTAYSDETIGTYGCGLTCAAMALSYEQGAPVTPDALANIVGDSCLTDRVNDMAKFTQFTHDRYGYDRVDTFWGTDSALDYVDDGWIVFAGVSGQLGDREYGSHVVMIWRANNDGTYALRDPDDGANSIKTWTRGELEAVCFGSFNAIRGEVR